MNKEEFNLSNTIVGFDEVMSKDKVIHIKNVKEFIKLLKEAFCLKNWEVKDVLQADGTYQSEFRECGDCGWVCKNCKKIDKLAGDKLNNLSNTIVGFDEVMSKDKVIHIKNVKEFIKLLKEAFCLKNWEVKDVWMGFFNLTEEDLK